MLWLVIPHARRLMSLGWAGCRIVTRPFFSGRVGSGHETIFKRNGCTSQKLKWFTYLTICMFFMLPSFLGYGRSPAVDFSMMTTVMIVSRSLWTDTARRSGQLVYPSILCPITLQTTPYKDYKLLMLMSFEVTTVTSMDSQEPTCCDDGHLLAS